MDTRNASSRRTIGLLVEQLDPGDSYTSLLWKECFDTAAERDCNLIILTGKYADSPDPADLAHTAAYRLVNRRLMSGAILSQTVIAQMTRPRLDRLVRDLPDLPLVTTGVKLEGYPCNSVDNSEGIRDLMRHLIEVHGCRRIAHLRGPQGNPEAAIREGVWREELRQAGLDNGADLLVQAHFDSRHLDRIGQRLMEQTGGNFDAVFACNDVAAFRALDELRAMGKLVTRDFLMAGFDDIRRCQFVHPALTTIAQPLGEQIRRCWDSLEALTGAGIMAPDTEFPTRLVVRASCGCGPAQWSPGAFGKLSATLSGLGGGLSNGAGNFFGPDLNPSPELLALLSPFDREQADILNRIYDLSNFLRALSHSQDLSDLPEILRVWLPRLGFGCYAVLKVCDAHGSPADCQALVEGDDVLPAAPGFFSILAALPAIPDERRVIPANELDLPEWFDLIEPFTIGAFPLVLGTTWHGLLFLQMGRDLMIIARIIQEQLAAILDREDRTRRYIRQQTEEQTRTRTETEKMKALTVLVSGMAHEVNTPLGISVTSSSYLATAVAEVAKRLEANALTRQDLLHCLNESQASLDMLQGNLRRVAGMLKDFRKVAVSEYADALQEFDLCELTRLTIATLAPGFEERRIKVELSCPPELRIRSWHLVCLDIISNLLMNALEHAFVGRPAGRLQISLGAPDGEGRVVMEFRDDGIGIPAADLPHVFEPFFSSGRGTGGTGLGLHVVFNLVTQKLGGTIVCHSAENQGTSVELAFPLTPA